MIKLCYSLVRAVAETWRELKDVATLQELAVDLLIIIGGCTIVTAMVYGW